MHLHVALGVGTLQLYTVGSAEGGWQYVAAGEPFSVSDKHERFGVQLDVSGKLPCMQPTLCSRSWPPMLSAISHELNAALAGNGPFLG